MDFLPVVSTFLLILVGELGDKTQIAVMTLSCNYHAKQVFVGAMLAFLAVDGASAMLGGPLLAMLPIALVRGVAGVVFIVFGVLPLIPRKEKEVEVKATSRLPLFACFSMIALMEIGDKTQLVTITLAAENPPLAVFVGLLLAFALLTSVAVLVGAKLLVRLPKRWLVIGTSALFIILGILSIFAAVFGIPLL